MKKNTAGRHTKYKVSFNNMAYIACAEGGFTDIKLAKLFSISKASLNVWKRKYKKFYEAIQRGKDEYDLSVAENSLRKRVNGYSYTEKTKERQVVMNEQNHIVLGDNGKPLYEMVTTKTVGKHVSPDPTSLKFFLKNRNPKRWPDKFDLGDVGDITVVVKKFSEKKDI